MSIPPKMELNTWFRRKRSNPNPKLRLFSFPHAGGGASMFRLWHTHLPTSVEVCPVQLPGRENRVQEKPYSNIACLINDLTEVVRPLLDVPFTLFGHSMGGLIAFELTRALRRKNMVLPDLLIIAGLAAPHDPDQPPVVHHLPQDEFIDYIRQLEGTPEEVLNNSKLMDFFLPLLRADFALYEKYQYYQEDPLQCPIVVYGGLKDESVPEKTLVSWGDLTSKSFKKKMFPGDHYFIRDNSEFLFRALIDDLKTLLE